MVGFSKISIVISVLSQNDGGNDVGLIWNSFMFVQSVVVINYNISIYRFGCSDRLSQISVVIQVFINVDLINLCLVECVLVVLVCWFSIVVFMMVVRQKVGLVSVNMNMGMMINVVCRVCQFVVFGLMVVGVVVMLVGFGVFGKKM